MSQAKPTDHPSVEVLNAFGAGLLSDNALDEVVTHVDQCQKCCDTLLAIDSGDTFVELLQVAHQQEVGETIDHIQNSPTVHSLEIPVALQEHPKYSVAELIGAGGMGAVYLAKHEVMDRTVALKVISPRFVESPQVVERFHREVRAAAKLSHPNIVTAYDAEQLDQTHFLAMEYVRGNDLADLVRDNGPLEIPRACKYIAQAARGLHYAHENNMVHRDIKPQNLMIDESDTCKILDFGLATLASVNVEEDSSYPEGNADGLTVAGAIIGTPDYISPEQAADPQAANAHSDVYSLGATLFYLLTGRPPFTHPGIREKLRAHSEETPPSLSTLREDVPQEVSTIIERMLAKSPDARFASCHDVAEALENWSADSRGVSSRPDQQIGSGTPAWFRPVLALATLLLLGLASTIYVVTDKATVVIESDSQDVKVEVSQNGESIEIVDLKTGTKVVYLSSGQYDVQIQGDATRFAVDQDQLTLHRGEKVIVSVERKDKAQLEEKVAVSKQKIVSKQRQLRSIAAISEMGGEMRFNRDKPSLVTVSLRGDRFNDAHLVHLRDLGTLESLYLPNTRITDDGAKMELAKLTTLVNLYVPSTQITDAGLKAVAELPNLRVLYTGDTAISDKGLEPLAQHNRLVSLSLHDTSISNQGVLDSLSKMDRLRFLELRGTEVDDECIEGLIKIPLVDLDLRNTKVSPEGLQTLRTALPNCKIRHSPNS